MTITSENFLTLFPKKGTRKVYRSNLNQYFTFLDMNPDRYFNSQWNYQADIGNYLERLKTQGCAKKTIYSKVGAIRSFLVENEVELSHKFWKRLGLCNDPTIRDKIPTPQELQSILTHMDCRGRSLYLLLASSGIRIGNALNQFLEIFHH